MKMYRRISWLGISLLFLSGLALAQGSKKETQLRTVRGLVTDKSEADPERRGLSEKCAHEHSAQSLHE